MKPIEFRILSFDCYGLKVIEVDEVTYVPIKNRELAKKVMKEHLKNVLWTMPNDILSQYTNIDKETIFLLTLKLQGKANQILLSLIGEKIEALYAHVLKSQGIGGFLASDHKEKTWEQAFPGYRITKEFLEELEIEKEKDLLFYRILY